MTGGAPPLRVLVVEDSVLGREMVLGLLRHLGHEAIEAADGAEAVAAAESDRFDVVLMDLELPDMDGFAATEAIRSRRAAVPVIALTAHDDEETRARCHAAGMAAHLAKPVRPDQLAAAIAGALGHTMDWSGALRALGGREALLRRVADAFREEAPRLLSAARTSLEAGDAEELRRAAHTLHGSMRWFDAPDAQERARALEQAALAPDWDEARRLLPALDASVARILPAVARFLRDL